MSHINELQEWNLSQCNGDWEHGFGVKINTLDNPGWTIDIDLEGTVLEEKPFAELSYGVGDDAETSGDEWLVCKVEDNKFNAAGGPRKLDEMIEVFLSWAKRA
jgi:hypothetical protein